MALQCCQPALSSAIRQFSVSKWRRLRDIDRGRLRVHVHRPLLRRALRGLRRVPRRPLSSGAVHERPWRRLPLRLSARGVRARMRQHRPVLRAAMPRDRHMHLRAQFQLHMPLSTRLLWPTLRPVQRMCHQGQFQNLFSAIYSLLGVAARVLLRHNVLPIASCCTTSATSVFFLTTSLILSRCRPCCVFNPPAA